MFKIHFEEKISLIYAFQIKYSLFFKKIHAHKL